jgi:DNA replication protein DnaC
MGHSLSIIRIIDEEKPVETPEEKKEKEEEKDEKEEKEEKKEEEKKKKKRKSRRRKRNEKKNAAELARVRFEQFIINFPLSAQHRLFQGAWDIESKLFTFLQRCEEANVFIGEGVGRSGTGGGRRRGGTNFRQPFSEHSDTLGYYEGMLTAI